jgi:hypothetical protein
VPARTGQQSQPQRGESAPAPSLSLERSPLLRSLRSQASAQTAHGIRRHRCWARELGHDCEQKSIRADDAEAQIVAALMSLKAPEDWRQRVTKAIAQMVGDQKLDERLADIREMIGRMDFRWDHGFITNKDDYLEQPTALQQELEQLTPIPDDDLALAADLLKNFTEHWEKAKDDPEEQERLFHLILGRAWVVGGQVVRIALRANFHVTPGLDHKRPTEISVDLDSYQNGSDGSGSMACIALIFIPRHVAQVYLRGGSVASNAA